MSQLTCRSEGRTSWRSLRELGLLVGTLEARAPVAACARLGIARGGGRHGTAPYEKQRGGRKSQRQHRHVWPGPTVLLLRLLLRVCVLGSCWLLEASSRLVMELRSASVFLPQVLEVGHLAEEAQLLWGPLLGLEGAELGPQPAAASAALLAALLLLRWRLGRAVAVVGRRQRRVAGQRRPRVHRRLKQRNTVSCCHVGRGVGPDALVRALNRAHIEQRTVFVLDHLNSRQCRPSCHPNVTLCTGKRYSIMKTRLETCLLICLAAAALVPMQSGFEQVCVVCMPL